MGGTSGVSTRRVLRNLLYFARYSQYCNICGYRVNFEGALSPEGLLCPACSALSRERMLLLCFQEALLRCGVYGSMGEALPILYNSRSNRVDKTVVETSPRLKGEYRDFMSQRFHYFDTDYDERAFRAARREDLQDLTFGDNSIDFILCSHVLEHVPDQDKALGELYRVIKPGGAVLIQVPLYYFETVKVDEEEYHADNVKVFWYTGWDLATRLEREGFTASIAVTGDLYDYIFKGKEISLISDPWDVSHMFREMDRVRTLPFEIACDSRRARLYGILPACNQHVFIGFK